MTRLISEFKYFIIKVISSIICLFCGSKNIIIFESASDFCDNTRALYDYMMEQKLYKKYKMVWFVRDDKTIEKLSGKYENTYFKKLSYSPNPFSKTFWTMMYYFSVASFTFYSHDFIGGEGNKKQKRIYLTHGAAPLKNTKGFYGLAKHNTDILITSEFTGYYSSMVLEGAIDYFRILGLPRCDKLFIKDENVSKVLPNKKFNKKIIWMPTFKHINNANRNDFKEEVKEDISLLNNKNIEKINKILKEKNMLLIIKFHPAQDMNYVKEFNKSNIITLTNKDLDEKDINLYSFMGECDALITDFSSVYFDYLLCNKPIAFELTDKEKFEKGIGFTFDRPFDYMPGDKIFGVDDFIKFVKDISDNKDNFKDDRMEFTKLCHKYIDGNSSKRVYEYFGFDNADNNDII